MTPDEEFRHTVVAGLARIEERQESFREVHVRQEASINNLHTKVNVHENKFSRMRGAMTVLASLFTGVIGLLGLHYWR